MLSKFSVFFLGIYFFALPISLGVMEISSSIICLLSLFTIIFVRKGNLEIPLGFWPALGLFLTGAVSCIANDLPRENLIHGIGKLRWVFTYFFIFNLMKMIQFEKKLPKLMGYFWAITILVACFAISQYWTGLDFFRDETFQFPMAINKVNTVRWRSIGFFNSPLTFGYVYAGFLCLLLALLLNRKTKIPSNFHLSHCFYLGAVVIFVSVLTSYSRGVWIALFASVFLVFSILNRKLLKILIVIAPVLILFYAALDSHFQDRFLSVFDFDYTSNLERIKIWRANWAMFKTSPVFGVGYEYNDVLIDSFFKELSITNAPSSHAHNSYLQFLVGTGTVGLFFYLMFLFRLIQGNMKVIKFGASRFLAVGILGLLSVVLVGNLTECAFKDAEINHMFIFFSSLLSVIYYREIKENRNQKKLLKVK